MSFDLSFSSQSGHEMSFADESEIGLGFAETHLIPVKDSELEAAFDGEIFGASNAVTERVAEGTWLKNQLWCNNILASVGYYLDGNIIRMFGIFGSHEPDGGTQITYQLRDSDSPNDPVELTLEDAPDVRELATRTAYYKTRLAVDGFTHHIDYRLCRVRLDSDGKEISRLYSAQYRYTVANGVCTRVRFKTAEQDSNIIIDVGLYAQTVSAAWTYNFPRKTPNQYTLLPLVSTNQTASYRFIVPDSFFNGATYGLSVVAVGGDWREYVGPTFDKAEYPDYNDLTNKPPALPALPTADGNYTLKLVMNNGVPTFSWV